MAPRFRLAPTPSGLLHIGNGVNFALTAAWAHALRGDLLLRVDDLDSARVRGEYYNDIEDTIRWMDLELSGEAFGNSIALAENVEATAPSRPANPMRKVFQANRLARYQEILDSLRQNNLVYACSCSRNQIRTQQEAAGGDINHYPGTCREAGISLDAPNVNWRLKLEEGGVEVAWQEGLGKGEKQTATLTSDFVIRQRNGRPSYQLASVVDDIDMGITHIVRGKDLWNSTIMQLVLAKAVQDISSEQEGSADNVQDEASASSLDVGAFAKTRFWHHDLVVDLEGRKLSKRDGDSSLRYMRDRRWGADIVFREAGLLMDVAQIKDISLLAEVLQTKP